MARRAASAHTDDHFIVSPSSRRWAAAPRGGLRAADARAASRHQARLARAESASATSRGWLRRRGRGAPPRRARPPRGRAAEGILAAGPGSWSGLGRPRPPPAPACALVQLGEDSGARLPPQGPRSAAAGDGAARTCPPRDGAGGVAVGTLGGRRVGRGASPRAACPRARVPTAGVSAGGASAVSPGGRPGGGGSNAAGLACRFSGERLEALGQGRIAAALGGRRLVAASRAVLVLGRGVSVIRAVRRTYMDSPCNSADLGVLPHGHARLPVPSRTFRHPWNDRFTACLRLDH